MGDTLRLDFGDSTILRPGQSVVEVFLSASESHNQSNVNMSVAQSLAQAAAAQVFGTAGEVPFALHGTVAGNKSQLKNSDSDAFVDRLVHNAYRLNLTGESMRKKRTAKPTTASSN